MFNFHYHPKSLASYRSAVELHLCMPYCALRTQGLLVTQHKQAQSEMCGSALPSVDLLWDLCLVQVQP